MALMVKIVKLCALESPNLALDDLIPPLGGGSPMAQIHSLEKAGGWADYGRK